MYCKSSTGGVWFSKWIDKLKGSQLDAFCPYAIVYLEFKVQYLKNLKLFSISVKELSELVVL